MSGQVDERWATDQAAFDPDGLYQALTRLLTGNETGADETYLPYPAATRLLHGAAIGENASLASPAPGPRREAISIVEVRADGLLVYASDTLPMPPGGLRVTIADGPAQTVRAAPAGSPEPGGLQRWLLALDGCSASAIERIIIISDGENGFFKGPALVSPVLPADLRVQFRRFSGDALWFGPSSEALADAVTGPIAMALNGEAGSVWRWARPTADKDGRALWRLDLDGLVRFGLVQDWDVSLPDGGAVARGRFLSFADDKDHYWMRPPEWNDREVAVTVVRDRPRQSTGSAIMLVTRESLVLEGQPVRDPAGFAFRARDNSYAFRLPTGAVPAHVSVRRHDQELFRLPVSAEQA